MNDTPPLHSEQLEHVEPWNDMLSIVFGRHELDSSSPRRMGRVGTHPTAIVGDIVVKLFAPLPDSTGNFSAETHAYRLLAGHDLPIPSLLASGNVYDDDRDWPWPYIVMSVVPGVDLTSCKTQLTSESFGALAEWLGHFVRRLQTIPHDRDWSDFAAYLDVQRKLCVDRHRTWATLPSHFVDEIAAWLPPTEELIGKVPTPVFVHNDLHEDHIFGRSSNGRFDPTGVIDFADMRFASPLSEVPAIHLGTFHGDKQLLKRFVATAAIPFDERLALALTLMFPFDLFTEVTLADGIDSLDDLATWLYEIDEG